VLALSSGCALGNALLMHQLTTAMVSGGFLLLGIALVFALLRSADELPPDLAVALDHREAYEAAWTSVPRLGEVLVHKYHWLTERDLTRALTYQRHSGGRIGEILVRMRVISPDQLSQALFEQRVEAGGAYPPAVDGAAPGTALGSSVQGATL
jgi:hypothetical protein